MKICGYFAWIVISLILLVSSGDDIYDGKKEHFNKVSLILHSFFFNLYLPTNIAAR